MLDRMEPTSKRRKREGEGRGKKGSEREVREGIKGRRRKGEEGRLSR